MEHIGLVGASSRTKSTELVARMTLPKEGRVERLPALAKQIGVPEMVYLATCNRVEVVFRGDGTTDMGEYRRRVFEALIGEPPRAGEAERALSAWTGEGAVEHLFLVAAGLDSARLGESEIRDQVREALTQAREAGVTGTLLDQVLTRALRVASQAHRQGSDRDEQASLADIALEHLFDRLDRTPGAVALLGVSPMTRRCGVKLAQRATSLVVVNRTPERGKSLARELGAAYRRLDAFQASPDEVEAVLVSTGSPDVLLGRAELEKLAARTPSCESPLVVDMSVPANTDREAAWVTGVKLVDMDAILNAASADRDERLVALAPARQLIDESLARLRRSMAERAMSPVIARLHQRYRETAVEGIDRLLRKDLSGLGEAEQEAVRRWAAVLAHRLAHVPIKGLRELAAEYGASAVKAFLDASGEDFFSDDSATLDRLRDLVETDVH